MAGYSGWQLGRSFLHRLSCHGCIFCIGLCRQNYQPVSRKNTKFCCVLLYKIHFLIPDVSPQYLAVYSVTHQLAGKAGTLRAFNEPSTFIYGSTNSQLTIKGHRQLFYGLDCQRRCLGVKCLQLSALHWRFIYSNCLAGIENIELRRLMSPGSHSLSW